MKRHLLVLLALWLSGARAEAHLNESSAIARSQAMGGALVSLADGPAALFVNPAGIVASANPALYLDYAEPAGISGGRESRVAFATGKGNTRGAIGWYRFGSESESNNLFAMSAAHRLIEGTQGSFLALGASATVGGLSWKEADPGEKDSRWMASGDAGIILKPLPIVAFAYSAGNIRDAHSDQTRGEEAWRRVQRWGASYFWEDRIVLSFATMRRAGRTTLHYGMAVKTAVPIELLAGFSDGRVTGGARWTGTRFGSSIAFAANEDEGVTWTLACEAYLPDRPDRETP
ncbi:MAG: hypothetical protein WC674_03305 [Candidatus Krumholzibacteriia bacterium]